MATPERPPKENLYRATNDEDSLTLTRGSGGEAPVLSGHAAVWDTWTEINSAFEGRFLERIQPGAFAKSIKENRERIRVLFQHGRDPMVADKPLGPLKTLEEDERGLHYEVDLLPTSYNDDLIPGLRAGLYGASFRFSMVQEDFNARPSRSEHNPLGLPERTLQEVRLMELGPVTWGAYPEATSGVRSVTDEFLAAQLLENENVVERLATELAKRQTFSVSFNGLGAAIAAASEKDEEEIAQPDKAADRADETEPDAVSEDRADLEPDPSEDTTPPAEPEPSAATTRSETSLFWFVTDPKLKGATKK